MTLAELQAEREKILKAMGQPAELTKGDKGIRFRTPEEYRTALASIDAEIAKLQGTDGRTFTIQTCRGI